MKKVWNYVVEVVKDVDEMQERLDKWALEGWELATVTPGDGFWVLIMKALYTI